MENPAMYDSDPDWGNPCTRLAPEQRELRVHTTLDYLLMTEDCFPHLGSPVNSNRVFLAPELRRLSVAKGHTTGRIDPL